MNLILQWTTLVSIEAYAKRENAPTVLQPEATNCTVVYRESLHKSSRSKRAPLCYS